MKLAEILAEEQAEIADGLTEFAHKEQAVFDVLKGEFDDSGECDEVFRVNSLNIVPSQSGAQIGHLLKAWGALFVMDANKHSLMVTDSEDSAAILFNAWEELFLEQPQLLVELELPVVGSIEAMKTIRDELLEAGAAIGVALKDIVEKGTVYGTTNLKAAAELWQGRIGATESQKRFINIYLLEGHSLREVWGRISGVPVENASGERQQNLVAVLRPAP